MIDNNIADQPIHSLYASPRSTDNKSTYTGAQFVEPTYCAMPISYDFCFVAILFINKFQRTNAPIAYDSMVKKCYF